MEDEEEGKKSEEILNVGFNRDGTLFTVSHQSGFSVFSTNPLKQTIDKNMDGGIGIAEILDKTNILALVGGGDNPKYPMDKI